MVAYDKPGVYSNGSMLKDNLKNPDAQTKDNVKPMRLLCVSGAVTAPW